MLRIEIGWEGFCKKMMVMTKQKDIRFISLFSKEHPKKKEKKTFFHNFVWKTFLRKRIFSWGRPTIVSNVFDASLGLDPYESAATIKPGSAVASAKEHLPWWEGLQFNQIGFNCIAKYK